MDLKEKNDDLKMVGRRRMGREEALHCAVDCGGRCKTVDGRWLFRVFGVVLACRRPTAAHAALTRWKRGRNGGSDVADSTDGCGGGGVCMGVFRFKIVGGEGREMRCMLR